MSGLHRRNELSAAFWAEAWLLGVAYVFSFFVTLLMLTSPMFMMLIYDRVLPSRSRESLVAVFCLVVMLLLIMGLFDYSRRRILARFGARLQQRLELRVIEAVEARASRTRSTGSRASGMRELDGLRGFFHSSSLVSVLDFTWTPVFLGAVFLIHPSLGWVALVGILLLFVLAGLRAVFSSHLGETADAASAVVRQASGRLQESQRTILSQGMAGPVVDGWLAARRRSRDLSILHHDRMMWFTTAIRLLRLLVQSTIVALGAHYVLLSQMTTGGMVACFMLLVRVFYPAERLLKNLPDLLRAIGNWKALDAILKSAPARGPEDRITSIDGAFEVRGLDVRRPDGRGLLLDGVDFAVPSGGVVLITGPIGAGKSVLARTLVGQQAIAAGTITLGGHNLEQFAAEEIGRHVGYLPEDVGFYPGTILQNIARMAPEADRDEVIAAARRAGAHRMVSALPRGYDTPLDAEGAPLSRGQRQKIALARALFGKPRLLVLDEPGMLSAASDLFRPGGPAIVLLGRSGRDLPEGSRHFRLDNGRLIEAIPDRATALPTQRASAPKLVNG